MTLKTAEYFDWGVGQNLTEFSDYDFEVDGIRYVHPSLLADTEDAPEIWQGAMFDLRPGHSEDYCWCTDPRCATLVT